MAGKGALARLLRLRELEEELSRQGLELAVGRQRQEQVELDGVQLRQAEGRARFVAGVREIDAAGRTGGLLEMELAEGQQRQVQIRLEQAEAEVARQRVEFLERRTERRQVQTLLTQQRTLAEVAAGRRAQQMLDDWYGRRGVQGADRGGATSDETGGATAHLRGSKS